MTTVDVHVEDRPAAAADLLHPLRRQILEALRTQPDSSAGLAQRLAVKRQNLNYHMRQLEDSGLLQLVETRKRRNMEERILAPSADAFLISPSALGELPPRPDDSPDRLSVRYLLAIGARMITTLGQLLTLGRQQNKKVAVLGMDSRVRFASATQRKAFSEELVTVVSELVTRYHDDTAPQGRSFELLLGVYPALTDHSQATPPTPHRGEQHDEASAN